MGIYTNTSSYGSTTGSSAYSPFNQSAQSQYPSAQQAPTMSSDNFQMSSASPPDMDKLSSSIDDKLAQIRAAMNSAPQTTPTQPQQPQMPANVSQEDIQWALQLEQKVQGQNYQPTAQETSRYEDIARKLQAAQQQPTQPQQPQMPANVSQEDIQWALQLEQKVQGQNYQPTAEDTARYEDIARKLQAAQQQSNTGASQSTGSRDWSTWGKPFDAPAVPSMPQPIANPSNGAPSVMVPATLRSQPAPQPQSQPVPATLAPQPQYTQPQSQPQYTQPQSQPQYTQPQSQPQYTQPQPQPQYTQPQSQPQYTQPQPQVTTGMVSQTDIQWALQLEQKVNTQNYQPTAQETARYENIARQLMAAQQQQQSTSQQGNLNAPANLVPQNYPTVQNHTPQMIQQPQPQYQQPYTPPQGSQIPTNNAQMPPALPGQQQEKPGLWTRFKNGVSAFWSSMTGG